MKRNKPQIWIMNSIRYVLFCLLHVFMYMGSFILLHISRVESFPDVNPGINMVIPEELILAIAKSASIVWYRSVHP